MFRDVQESRRRDTRSVDHVPKRRRLADEDGGGQGGSWRPRTFRHADMNPAPFRHHPGEDTTAPYVEYDPLESVFFADMNPAPGADNTAPYVEYGPLESVYEPSVLAGQRSASPSRHASSSQATPSSRERLAMHGSPWQGASASSDLQAVRYGRYGGRLQSPTTGQKLSGSARGGYDQQFGFSEQQHKQQQPQPLMALDLDYHHERSDSYREASVILSEDEFQGISSEGEYEHLQYSNYGGDNDRPPLQQQQSTTQGDNEDADLHSREKQEINQEQESSEELQFIVPAWKCTLCSTFASSMEETRKHEAEPGHCERARQAKAQQKVQEILKAEIRRQEERKRLEQQKAEEVERKKQQQQQQRRQKDQAEEEEEERRKQAEVWELRRKIMELEEVHNKLQDQLLKPDHPPELTASSKQSPRTAPNSKQSSRTAPRSKAPLKRSPPTVPTTQSKPPSFKLENLKKHVKHKKHTTEHPRSHSVPEPKQEVVAAVKKVKVKLKRPTKTSTTATQQPINAHSSGKEPTEELYDIQVHPDTPEFDQYQPSSKETGRLPLPLHSQQPSKETGRLPQPFQSSSKETGRLPPPFQSSSKETGRLPQPFQSSSKETGRLPPPFQSSSKETARLPPPFLQPPLASRRQVWSYRQVHEDTEYRLPRLPHTTAAAATRQSSDYQHQRDFNY